MRALFKPTEADKIIISGADYNEQTLITEFVNKASNGFSLSAEKRYDFNNEIDGLVISLKEIIVDPTEEYIYLPFANITQGNDDSRVFKLTFEPDSSSGYTIFKYDTDAYNQVKASLEALGLQDVEISSHFEIIARNETGGAVFGTLEIPKGLFQMINSEDNRTIYFTEATQVELRG